MHDGGGSTATEAMRMLGEEACTGSFPLAIISALSGCRALLVVPRLVLPLPGDSVLTLRPRGDDAAA